MLKISNCAIDIALRTFEKNYKEIADKIVLIQFGRLDDNQLFCIRTNDDNDRIIIELAIEDSEGYCFGIDEVTDMLVNAFAHLISDNPDNESEEFNEAYNTLNDLILNEFEQLTLQTIDDNFVEGMDCEGVQ